MDAAENVLRAGDRLDRYELLCPIASGGMATVWLARMRGKRGFEKLFAVKTIRTELVEDPRFQEMFLDEARIASGIQHPNVAQILDLGEQRDVLFIVMEWVDGDSLAKVRKLVAKQRVTLPIGIALRALADACAGLHSAHELRDDQGQPLGIVHRDVSPQNILVAASGTIKVIDFGIAKAHNRKQGETGTGVVKGKIQYMAPEQVKKGRTVDRRTDVWALGVCLHELVSGRFPNDGEDDVEVIRRLLHDEPPQRAPGLPEPIVRVLDRSLVLEPDDRFPTAAGMQRALESAMKELGDVATSDDVAAFLRTSLPELAERREDARDRSTPIGRYSESGEEVAFAPTVVSEDASGASGARPTEEGAAIALTKRKAGESGAPPETVREPRARPLWGRVDSEPPPSIPKRGLGGLWAALGVALLVFAGGAVALRRSLGPSDVPPGAAPAPPSTAANAAAAPVPPPPLDLPIVPSATAAPEGSATVLPARPHERGAAEPAEARPPSPASGWFDAAAPLAASAAPPLSPSAAPPATAQSLDAGIPAAADALAPPAAAQPAPASAQPPADAEDDSNNPYN
jgi:serine/threonine-protein kinase